MKDVSLSYFQLPNALTFFVEGRDATRYLNARLTNDIKSLSPGSTCLAGMLTAQGRTQGLFRVLALPEGFLLVSDAGDSSLITAALKKFIVADRVTVTEQSAERTVIHLIGNDSIYPNMLPRPPELAQAASSKEDIYSVRANRGAELGTDLVLPRARLAELFSALQSSGAMEFSPEKAELLRLKAALPAFPSEINEESLFSEAGLKEAISFKKGCYVGQEVIEKVDAMGRLPRRLAQVSFDGPTAPLTGATLLVSGVSVGKILSIAHDAQEQRSYGLASVKNSGELIPGTRLECAGVTGELLS